MTTGMNSSSSVAVCHTTEVGRSCKVQCKDNSSSRLHYIVDIYYLSCH